MSVFTQTKTVFTSVNKNYSVQFNHCKRASALLYTVWLFCFGAMHNQTQAQNIGINVLMPDPSAVLDVTANTRGMLVPRVQLVASNNPAPVVAPALSLLVFNLLPAGVFPNNVKTGYYYWDGTKWVGIGTGNAWELTGNAGTTAGTNFVGTTDAQDLVFKTNGVENMRVQNGSGNVGIGTNAPLALLHLNSLSPTNLRIDGNSTGYLDASLELRSNNGLNTRGLGIIMTDAVANNSWYSGRPYGGSIGTTDVYVINRQIASPSYSESSALVDGGGGITTTRNFFTIINNGNVGINTTIPNNSAKLDVTSTTSGFAMPRMTSAQRKAIVSPIAGLEVYDLTLKGQYTFDGTKWDCSNNPAGSVNYFANATAPNGYLEANGQAVNRTTYAELFTAIGTLYGVGDGSTTFNLPDLRGEFVRGVDNARGVDAGRVIGSGQIATQILIDDDELQVVGVIDAANNNLPLLGYENGNPTSIVAIHYNNATASATGIGPSFLRSVRPRNVAMLPCIKF